MSAAQLWLCEAGFAGRGTGNGLGLEEGSLHCSECEGLRLHGVLDFALRARLKE